MKGYRVVLPPKDEEGSIIMGRGVKIYAPDGTELEAIMDFRLGCSAGDMTTLTIEVPVSVVEHEAEYPGILKAGDKVIGGDQ
jgi:hypothetical protein